MQPCQDVQASLGTNPRPPCSLLPPEHWCYLGTLQPGLRPKRLSLILTSTKWEPSAFYRESFPPFGRKTFLSLMSKVVHDTAERMLLLCVEVVSCSIRNDFELCVLLCFCGSGIQERLDVAVCDPCGISRGGWDWKQTSKTHSPPTHLVPSRLL